jgi:hypothetical protein
MRSVPLLGSRVSSAVDATQAAAGRRIEEIASGASRTPPDRALAGATLRPAIQDLIERNNGEIDRAYQDLRRVTDTNRLGATPRTRAALDAIRRARRGARMANPDRGIEDIISLVRPGGVTFNGLQRARNHMAQVIAWAKKNPNPGFDVADLHRIYAAMTGDMEGIVRQHATVPPDRAADALNLAHMTARTFIEQNGTLQRVLNIRADERMAGALITAAQEKTGNLRLLAELRSSLPPDDFHMIAGSLLNELGHSPATGEFSLNRFVTNWSKISKNARQILFSPQHLQNIEDIVGMGEHIKGALRESNTSHTAGVLMLFDVARDAILLGATMAAGTMSGTTMAGGALATPGLVFMHWLARPAVASSMARWARARQALYDYGWTPARLAAFNLATRNLANTLGVPPELFARHVPELNGSTAPAEPRATDPRVRPISASPPAVPLSR